jgi:hypothetical protein
MSDYDFYGVNIVTPMSLAHNTPEWDNSVVGRLNAKTEGQVYIREIPPNSQNAEYGWRVVDAFFSQEDVYVTYFRAYDVDGNYLPEATFGVNYGTVPSRIMGGFKYKPEFGNQYYVPVQNDFPTVETGGYTVQVLDMKNPSEGMAFGMFKQGEQHQCLIISFRLVKLGDGYPNDHPDLRIR